MPIFEYQCDECHRIKEIIIMSRAENRKNIFCLEPDCRNGVMTRIMSAHSYVERVNLRIPKQGSRQRKKIK